jgi:hypothetical protein
VRLALGDVNGFREDVHCVPTALCAISGKTPEEIAKVLQQAAADCGDAISDELRRDYNIKHWLQAIKTLGGDYATLHNWAHLPHDQRPLIDAYLAGETSGRLKLVFCDHPTIPDTHVFAVENGHFTDSHTGGKRVALRKFPPEYDGFRVKGVFAVLNH